MFSYFRDVLAIDPTSVRSNIDVAKIYSSILPYNYRDNTFAMACIKRALMFHPNSSKANHRMAALLISQVSHFVILSAFISNGTGGSIVFTGSIQLVSVIADQSDTVASPIIYDGVYSCRGYY